MAWISAVFFCLGAADTLLGDRLGLGSAFRQGFAAVVDLLLLMTGFMALAPWLGTHLAPVITPVFSAVGCDPSLFEKPGCERVEVETDGENPQHAGVLNAFAANIQTGAPLVADGREGINGLMLSNAIHLSSWLGETVTLPIDEKKFLNLLNKRRAHSRLKEDTDVVMDTASSYGGGAK